MNAEHLLAHYDRVADTPEAIPRLRRFVLDLAVRGKLVEQDSNDASVSALLAQIAKGKTHLVQAGTIRKPRDLGGHDDVLAPFEIPTCWHWVRLDSVGAIVGGGTPSATDANNFAEPGTGVPWLTPADLGNFSKLFISGGTRDLSETGFQNSSATLMPTGTVLFTSRAPIGYVAISTNPISTNQGFKSIVPYISDCSQFIALSMKAFAPTINATAPGTTFKEVSGKIVAGIPFPLPPLAEQHRIVAKVAELMALCDQLEAARKEQEAVRNRMSAASLARINAPDSNPSTFQSHATFTLENLTSLTTRPDQIKALRQTILNLAIRGKLVPQDPTDEPASEILARISTAKAKRKQETRDARITIAPDANSDSLPFELPDSWCVQSFENLFLFIDYRGRTPKKTNDGVALITAKNVRMGFLNREPREYVSESTYGAWMTRGFPRIGDLFFTTEAPLGNVCLNDIDEPFALAQRVICMQPYADIDTRFLMYGLMSDSMQLLIAEHATGLTAKGIKAAKLKPLPIPIPPRAEQHRIVGRVDALMALCDRLEKSLATRAYTRRRLLDALLYDALAPETPPQVTTGRLRYSNCAESRM